MKVFLAGATGVIGQALLPRLIQAGYNVTAMTRSPERAVRLAALGAEPIVCDIYDATGVENAMRDASPDAVVHQLTSLPAAIDPSQIETQLEENDRIRVEGTRNLVRAAKRSGARRIVAQSLAFAYAPQSSRVKTEEDPLWLDAPWPWRRSVEALVDLERQVTTIDGMDGVALRYGNLYGRGTAYAVNGSFTELVRAGQISIVGAGTGVFSFVHVDDAAAATVMAIRHERPGVYNIVDDDPAAVREWLPTFSEVVGGPPPVTVPVQLAEQAIGSFGVYMMTEQRGASNSKVKRELGWSPARSSWRTGFREDLASAKQEKPGPQAVSARSTG